MENRRGPAFLALLLVIITLMQGQSSGLQVYDCDGPNTTYQVVLMLEPESCPDPEKDYGFLPRLETVQVLQSQDGAHVTAHQCLIKSTIRVTRCGLTSITYRSHIVEWRNTLAVTKEDCKALVETRQIKLGRKGEERTLRIRPSGSLTTTLFTKGNLNRDGDCEHANFMSGGQHYSKSYEQTTYEITTKTIKAQHRNLVDTIILQGGIRGRFSDGFLQDDQLGTIVWDTTPANFTHTFSQVYLGTVRLFKCKECKDKGRPALLGNSIVMLDHEVGEAVGVKEEKYWAGPKIPRRSMRTQVLRHPGS